MSPHTKKPLGRPRCVDRAKLIDAAEKCFAAKGFSATSVRELAKTAGCNSALISYHFGGKEGLYQAVLQKHFERSTASANVPEDEAAAYLKDWPEFHHPLQKRFCAVLLNFCETVLASKALHSIVAREVLRGGKGVIKALKGDSGFLILKKNIEALQNAKLLKKDLNSSLAIVALIGPILYSAMWTPVLKEVYGFKAIDREYMRTLCVYLSQNLFSNNAI